MYLIFKNKLDQQQFHFNDQALIRECLSTDPEYYPVFMGFVLFDEIRQQYIDDINLEAGKILYTVNKEQCFVFNNFQLIKLVNTLQKSKVTIFALYDLKLQPFLHLHKLVTFEGEFYIDFPHIQGINQAKLMTLIYNLNFQHYSFSFILNYFIQDNIAINFENLFAILSVYHGSSLNIFANYLYDLAENSDQLKQIEQLQLFKTKRMADLINKSILEDQKKPRYFKMENEAFFDNSIVQVLKDALQNIKECYYRCGMRKISGYMPEHRYLFHTLFRFREDYFPKLKLTQCYGIDKIEQEFNRDILKVYASDDIPRFKSFCKKIMDMLDKIIQFYEHQYSNSLKKSNFSSELKKTNQLNKSMNNTLKSELLQISTRIKQLTQSNNHATVLHNKIEQLKSKLNKFDIALEKKTISQAEYLQKTAKIQKKIEIITAEINQKQDIPKEQLSEMQELKWRQEELEYADMEDDYTQEKMDFSCLDADFNHKHMTAEKNFIKSVILNM